VEFQLSDLLELLKQASKPHLELLVRESGGLPKEMILANCPVIAALGVGFTRLYTMTQFLQFQDNLVWNGPGC